MSSPMVTTQPTFEGYGKLEGPAGGEVKEVPGVLGGIGVGKHELWEVEGGAGLKPPTILDHTQTTGFRQGRISMSCVQHHVRSKGASDHVAAIGMVCLWILGRVFSLFIESGNASKI